MSPVFGENNLATARKDGVIPVHDSHRAGTRLVTLSYESKGPDSRNVSEDKNGAMRVS
jgi:hypothetical protein